MELDEAIWAGKVYAYWKYVFISIKINPRQEGADKTNVYHDCLDSLSQTSGLLFCWNLQLSG